MALSDSVSSSVASSGSGKNGTFSQIFAGLGEGLGTGLREGLPIWVGNQLGLQSEDQNEQSTFESDNLGTADRLRLALQRIIPTVQTEVGLQTNTMIALGLGAAALVAVLVLRK